MSPYHLKTLPFAFLHVIIFTFCCFSPMAYSYENKMALKGGLSLGLSQLRSRNNKDQLTPTFGIVSYYGKKWTNWEFGITSQANIGLWDEQSFLINQSIVTGKGHFRSLSFGPYIRKYFNFKRKKHWQLYLTASPLFGLKTYKFSDTSIEEGAFQEDHKITYRSAGPMISIGLAEQLEKSQRPSFVEITYRFLNSSKRTEVGGTTTEVESIIRENDNGSISEHTFVVTWGILIF